MSEKYVTEKFLQLQLMEDMAKKLYPVFDQLGARRVMSGKFPVRKIYDKMYHYRLNNADDYKRRNELRFSNLRYNPLKSKVEYGDSHEGIDADPGDVVPTFSKVYINDRNVPFNLKIQRSVIRSKKVTVEMNKEFRADFGIKSSAEASGGIPGVGEAKISTEISVSFGTTIQINNQKEVQETVTEDHTIETEMPPRSKVRVNSVDNKSTIYTPFKIKGVLDFNLKLDFEDWADRHHKLGWMLWRNHKGDNKIYFKSRQEILAFLFGKDYRYPRMDRFFVRSPEIVKKAIKYIEDDNNFTVEAEGVRTQQIEDSAEITLKDLSLPHP